MIIDYPWYFVLLCLLAGASYAAGLYYVGRRSFSKRANALLSVLRFVAVSVIALLLLAPVARRTVHERQKPLVVLVDDCSKSVKMSADSSFTLQTLQEELENDYRIAFNADSSNTGQTNLSALLNVTPDAAAVVLASDGIHNRGANPTSTAERMGIPIYTVALGDTTPQRDAAIANVWHNRIAMMGNDFPVEVTLTAHLLGGHSTVLSIDNGPNGFGLKQRVDYTGDDDILTFNFTLPASRPGLQRYTVHLTPEEGESSLSNNTVTFYVDIIDSRRKVAIIGNAPHPDLAALKQAIESNPNYEAQVILASEIESGKWKPDEGVSLAILHNIPSTIHNIPKELAQLPQMYIIGTQTDLSRFNALHSGLEIVSKVKKSNEVTALYNDRFALFILDGNDAQAIEQLPPLDAPFGEAKTSAAVQSLFTARLGNIDTRQPLIAASLQGDQRRTFVWGEGLWKWRLSNYMNNSSHGQFDRMISQLVNFTAMNERRDRFIVETERHYSDNERIVITAQLYNDAYEPYNSPDATFSLTGDSLNADYNFSRQGSGYSLTLDRLPEGLYRYTAATTHNGTKLTAEGSFAVEALHLEEANLTANHALLATISTLTGGEMVYPSNLSTLHSVLSSLKPVIYTHTRFSELTSLPWILILILLLLGGEWSLRKYHGEI